MLLKLVPSGPTESEVNINHHGIHKVDHAHDMVSKKSPRSMSKLRFVVVVIFPWVSKTARHMSGVLKFRGGGSVVESGQKIFRPVRHLTLAYVISLSR